MSQTQDTLAASATAAPNVARRRAAIAFAVALLAVEAVIILESYRGLTGFADMIGIRGAASWGVPISLDGVALASAMLALRAELAGEASGVYRATMFAFTGASAAANWYHGIHLGGAPAALYLGGMSLAVAWVFSLSLRQIRHESRREAGISAPRLPRFSPVHWARYPGLTFRAFSLAVRDGHATARAAIDAASVHAQARDVAPVAAVDAPPRPALPAPSRPVSRDSSGDIAGMSLADAIRRGFSEVGDRPRDVAAWLAGHGRPGVQTQRICDVRRRDARAAEASGEGGRVLRSVSATGHDEKAS
jgi:hypothetical protein